MRSRTWAHSLRGFGETAWRAASTANCREHASSAAKGRCASCLPGRWPATPAPQWSPLRRAKELLERLKDGGEVFCDAVVRGGVTANFELLGTVAAIENHSESSRSAARRLLSTHPSVRPTAATVRDVKEAMRAESGLAFEQNE